jgi:hypothetical protein
MYALQQHAQCICPRVLALACPSYFLVADIKGGLAPSELNFSIQDCPSKASSGV